MNYRDAELLNSSIRNLGDSLLRERMFKEEKQERATSRQENKDYRDKQLGLEQERLNITKTGAAASMQDRTKATAQRTFGDTVDMMGGWVKDGIVDPQVAQDKLKATFEQMSPDQQALIRDHPAIVAILDDEPIWQKPPARELSPRSAPADVEVDAAASRLEAQAASEADPAVKDVLLSRAKKLRSGIGREDPADYIEEIEHKDFDEATGRPTRTVRRRIPAGQVGAKKELTLEQAQKFLQEAGGDKVKARELARKAGYTF
jgi:hypothetical protein